MPLVSEDSIILQAFPYSETSKVLRLLTREHGLQSVIAKGALKPRSRYGGVLEPFTSGVAEFFRKESRDLHTLSAFELTQSRQRLGKDLVRFGAASLMAETVLRTGVEQADAELFVRLERAFDRLEIAPDVESVALAEAWSLIGHLGFAPALDECLGCGRSLDDDEETSFDYSAGGVRCATCAQQAPGRPLPAAARLVLSRLSSGEAVPLERTAAHWRLLARYLTHHVLEGQQLRSLDFLAESLAVSD